MAHKRQRRIGHCMAHLAITRAPCENGFCPQTKHRPYLVQVRVWCPPFENWAVSAAFVLVKNVWEGKGNGCQLCPFCARGGGRGSWDFTTSRTPRGSIPQFMFQYLYYNWMRKLCELVNKMPSASLSAEASPNVTI